MYTRLINVTYTTHPNGTPREHKITHDARSGKEDYKCNDKYYMYASTRYDNYLNLTICP